MNAAPLKILLNTFVLLFYTQQMYSQNEYRVLTKGDVFLYKHSSSSVGWSIQRMGVGNYPRTDFDGKKDGYFFTTVVKDTIIRNAKFWVIYTSPVYVNSRETFYYPPAYFSRYEYSTTNAIIRFSNNQLDTTFSINFTDAKDCNRIQNGDDTEIKCSGYFSGGTITDPNTGALRPSGSRNSWNNRTVFTKGLGLTDLSYYRTYVNYGFIPTYDQSGEGQEKEEIKFIGAKLNGKVVGDSLVTRLSVVANVFQSIQDTSLVATLEPVLYPNPSSDRVIVEFSNPVDNSQIQIFDVTGKKVDVFVFYDERLNILTAFVSELSSGIYMIRAMDKKTKKIVGRVFVKN